MQSDTILELENIVKKYPGVLALDHMNISFKKGEVHALVGENGAGKSTLIKICTGAIEPTSGTIKVKGKEYSKLTPQLSRSSGIAVIYQEFTLVNELSVADNIFLGEAIRKGCWLDKKSMRQKTRELFQLLNVDIDPDTLVGELSVGFQQMVEIAKAISKDPQVLIMDEPTAPLTTREVEELLEIVQRLKKLGVTVIYISHRLDEIFRIADRVTVLRDGKYVGTDAIEDTDKNQLIRQMVGRTLTEVFPERKNKRGEKVLEIEHLCGNGLEDISLEAYSGEILGLAGLVGAGRTQLAELLFGVKRPRSGKILVRGQEVKLKSPSEAIKTGISLVPEDRKQQGVLLDMSVSDNIIIPGIRKISRGTLVNKRKAKQIVQKHIEDLKIKTPNSAQTVKNLSGGNQQKVVLAKWLAIDPDIIIFDEPTRGIDVGAKHEIYLLMTQLAEQGKTILMITSEMEELLGMADRILVLSEGRLTGMLSGDEIEQERVLALASKNIQEENLAYENA